MHPFITMLGKEIPSYFTMLIFGFCAGLAAAMLRRKVNGLSVFDTFVAMLLAGVGALLGGKLFYAIQGIPEFLILHERTGITFLRYFNQSGLVYYGAFIGSVLFILLFAVIYKIPFWKTLDALLPSLPLAQAFGRVGCFLAGCCYGIPFEGGVVFRGALEQLGTPRDIPLLPVQLIESGCVLALFFFMVRHGRKARPQGRLFSLYLIGYGAIRFTLEFFRYDAIRGFAGALSVSQWVSLAAIALGVYFAKFYRPAPKVKMPTS